MGCDLDWCISPHLYKKATEGKDLGWRVTEQGRSGKGNGRLRGH